jgi:hypothetical protein
MNYYTTARELLNWNWSWEDVISHVCFDEYVAIKCMAPYFVYGQVSTHTQITSVSHSNRYTESPLGYYKPSEVSTMTQEAWNDYVDITPPLLLKATMKEAGVVRREIWSRGADMLQYREFTLGGYLNNPNAFPHFINQRLHDSHTQLETREFTKMIKETI